MNNIHKRQFYQSCPIAGTWNLIDKTAIEYGYLLNNVENKQEITTEMSVNGLYQNFSASNFDMCLIGLGRYNVVN